MEKIGELKYIMEDWKEYRLGDICLKIGSGATPSGGKEAYKGGNFNLVRSQNVLDFSFSDDGLARINDEQAEKLKNVELYENDVLLNITGDSVARSCILPNWVLPARVNQHVCILRANPDFLDYRYLLYFIQIKKSQLLTMAAGGATRNALTKQMLEDFEINLPPLLTQQKIAQILSSLDDKIELNNKINANLEQQAQALFKSWFVNFENSSDFTKKTLDEVTVNLRERILDQNTPVLSAVNTGCLQRSDDYFSKQVYSKDISKYILVKIGDFAYNPARINIGSIGINDFDYDGCVSPVYVAFSVDPSYKSFFKYYFKSNSFKEETKTRASGSVRQSLNYDDFAKIQINYPSRELASKFEAFYTSIESSMKKIKKENESLISIRDTLLPKLMNGEIEV